MSPTPRTIFRREGTRFASGDPSRRPSLHLGSQSLSICDYREYTASMLFEHRTQAFHVRIPRIALKEFLPRLTSFALLSYATDFFGQHTQLHRGLCTTSILAIYVSHRAILNAAG